MTEDPELHDAEPVRTGLDNVDTVIAAVQGLEERPLEEHVGVFETAHELLRRALDGQEPPTAPQADEQSRPS
jgi:hypothetical protein